MSKHLMLPLALTMGGFSALGVAGAGWLLFVREKAPEVPVRHVAMLLDRSDSMEDGKGSSCAALTSMVGHVIKIPGVTPKSQVRVFLTGDGVGQLMPTFGPAIQVPHQETGEMAATSEMLNGSVTREVETFCRANMTQLRRSPVLSSIDGVVQTMRANWGCSASHPCSLLVRSDLQETESPRVVSALKATGAKRDKLVDALAPLDLTGLTVTVCGTGQSTERIDDARRATTVAVWSRLLPGVTLSPSCL